MNTPSPLLPSLTTTGRKAIVGATGRGWIRCSARTAAALIECGLATREGEQVRITTAGRELQNALLADLHTAGRP